MKKINNPVAKQSRNKSAAGAHKSAKDYSRKMKHNNLGMPESIANKIDRLIILEQLQNNTNSGSLWFDYEEQRQLIVEELREWQMTE